MFEPGLIRTHISKVAWTVEITVSVILIMVLVSMSLNSNEPPPESEGCIKQLREIQAAKLTWALEFKKLPGDKPTEKDLFGPGKYIMSTLRCPQEGIYTLGAVSSNPRCSFNGHQY